MVKISASAYTACNAWIILETNAKVHLTSLNNQNSHRLSGSWQNDDSASCRHEATGRILDVPLFEHVAHKLIHGDQVKKIGGTKGTMILYEIIGDAHKGPLSKEKEGRRTFMLDVYSELGRTSPWS